MTARVLIVDDLLANLKLIEARLSAEYFEVLTATNGADALALCASGKCDIVLLDVMMPGMDGLEVCRRSSWSRHSINLPACSTDSKPAPMISSPSRSTSSRSSRGLNPCRDRGSRLTNCAARPFAP